MQLKNRDSFIKQLHSLTLISLPQIFLVAALDGFERSTILRKCLDKLKELHKEISFTKIDPANSFEKELHEISASFCLFSEKRVIWIDGCETLKKGGLTALAEECSTGGKDLFFLLGFSSLKGAFDLLDKGKKQMLMLDLTGEKPWDKEKRLIDQTCRYFANQGVKIGVETVKHLIFLSDKDPSYLAQNQEKISCYIGDKKEIRLEDIEINFAKEEQKTVWQMGQELVWNAKLPLIGSFSTQDLLGMIHQIRTHLQLGSILSQMETLYEIPSIASDYPYVKPADMQRFFQIAKTKPSPYFLQGLHHLLLLEVGIKTVCCEPSALFDQFYLRWQSALSPL